MKKKFNVIEFFLLWIFKYFIIISKSCTLRTVRNKTAAYFYPTKWQQFERPRTLDYLWTIKVVCWTYNILYKELQSTQAEKVYLHYLDYFLSIIEQTVKQTEEIIQPLSLKKTAFST